MAEAAYGSLPFTEQIAFFRRKLNLTTEDWTQLFGAAHDHAFVVAGANRQALVEDLRQAIDKAISQGTTLEEFRRDFDTIVARYGWDYNGGRNWRTQVIYQTNLRSSYMAGRWHQLQAVKQEAPYWEYVHSDLVQHPRLQHLAWNGLVLHADDPWWQEHFPPNGWGCQCTAFPRSREQLERMGKSVGTAPTVNYQQVRIGTQGAHPRTVEVPEGVDPGFGHAPGATVPTDAWLPEQSAEALDAGAASDDSQWTRLLNGSPDSYGLPKLLPEEESPIALGTQATDEAEILQAVEDSLGGTDQIWNVKGLPVAVDAEALASHVPMDRSQYLPLLADLMTDPQEVWIQIERNAQDYYALKARILKVYRTDKRRAVLLVAEQRGGLLQAWTVVPARQLQYIQKQRSGYLWYAKDGISP